MDCYSLKHPVTLSFREAGGNTREEVINEITLRRPTAKDMRLADRLAGQEIGMMISMLVALSGLDEHVIDRLDVVDFTELSEIVDGFLPNGPKAGKTD